MNTRNNVGSFLDEDFLRKLEQLRILAQRRVKGVNVGSHISWKSGGNLEFLEYRKYQLGDDLRYVDWNVYGRLDKLFIKLFQAERDLSIHILIDMSRSMAAGEPPKEIYAKKIAAALSYIGLANLDRVGVTSFDRSLALSRTPEKGRQVYLPILEFLHALKPEHGTNLDASLVEFASSRKHPGIAILLSDLLDPAGFENGLKSLVHGKLDVIVIQILDTAELFPNLDGYLRLKDMETGEKKNISLDAALVEKYRSKMENYIGGIKDFCFKTGIDYYLTDTGTSFEDFLLDFLTEGNFAY